MDPIWPSASFSFFLYIETGKWKLVFPPFFLSVLQNDYYNNDWLKWRNPFQMHLISDPKSEWYCSNISFFFIKKIRRKRRRRNNVWFLLKCNMNVSARVIFTFWGLKCFWFQIYILIYWHFCIHEHTHTYILNETLNYLTCFYKMK